MTDLAADIVVIGAGSGGLTLAAAAARFGLNVVLFEAGRMGGDCLNYGCVPSKALISAAAKSRDFGEAMRAVEDAVAEIAPRDSQAGLEGLGVRVIRERARFASPRVVRSDSVEVRARKIVVATGSRPSLPDLVGLAQTPYLTNETVFDLTERPDRLIVLGAGVVGMELGQAFRRLGAEVVIVDEAAPLSREEPAAVEEVLRGCAREHIELVAGAKALRTARSEAGVRIEIGVGGSRREIEGSHLLVATGRTPNLESLDLGAGHVVRSARGVTTDRSLRSISNRAVYAIGDAAGREAFTHAAGAHAALVIRRAVFGLPTDVGRLVIPRVIYTDPEIAAVGLTEREARERHGERIRAVVLPFADNDRAATERDTRGFAKLVATRAGRVLGATIVGAGASELIHPWVLALSARLPLRTMSGFVPPYPTRGDINRALAAEWGAESLFSPPVRAFARLAKLLA